MSYMTATNGFPTLNAPVRIKLSLREAFAAAWDEKRILFFSAPCGFGKTAAAGALLAGKEVAYLSAREPVSLEQLDAAVLAGCLVLDDAQDLLDEEIQNHLITLLEKRPGFKLVVLSRGMVPNWLSPFKFRGEVKVFGTSDLVLDSVAAAHLFQDYSVPIPAASLALIMEESMGYPLAVCSCIRLMSEGAAYSPALSEEVTQDLFDYFEIEVFRRFDACFRELLLCASLFDDIDIKMIEAVSGNRQTHAHFEYLRTTTAMALRTGAGFCFWGVWRNYLAKKRDERYTPEEINGMYERAGDYCCQEGNVADALSYYERAGRPDKVRQLLIDNARKNVVKGSYYGAQSYYCRLTQEEIENSPLLIQGMSYISALQLRYADSDYWQGRLLVFADNDQNTDIRRREARVRYAYTDLVLPHRGSANMRARLQAVSDAVRTQQIDPLQYSLISARGSVVNGLHDYGALLAEEGEEGLATLKPLLEEVFGAEGTHFADCLLIESRFLRNEVTERDVMELTKTLTRVRRDQLPEMEMAVTSLLARVDMARGESDHALDLLSKLRIQLESDVNTRRLVPAVDALRILCQVQVGMEADVARWLSDEAPQETTRPRQTQIDSYLAMAIGLVSVGEYHRALSITCIFDEYLRGCDREIDLIFAQTLSALCLRQLGEEWRPQMAEALELAEKRGYVQPFAVFADAIVPMVRNSGANVPAAFLAKVEELAVRQSLRYPQFVKSVTVLEKPLTDTEQRVLELICNDMNNAQICEILDIKLPTVKTHVSHVFAKLGCKRRADARMAAARLGLV